MVLKPKLVATDLDGTLLRSDGTVSPRTQRALAHLESVGVPLVIVTGRPIRWMDDLWGPIGGHALAILSNGALVFDVAAREIRETHTIAASVVIEVADRLRDAIPGTAFALEMTNGVGIEPAFLSRYDQDDRQALDDESRGIRIGAFDSFVGDPVVKLLAQHEVMAPETFWATVHSVVGDLVTTTWSSENAMVEISAQGVTKASTLALLAADLGLGPEHVLAFGDMPNDIAMLEWAGSSYAMANAHPLAITAADLRASSNDEDGVAQVLEAVFAIAPS